MTFSFFSTLDKIVEETCEPTFGSRLIFLMGNYLNQLPYFFEVLLVQNNHFCHNMNGIQTSCISVLVGHRTKQFVKGNLYKCRKKTIIFGKLYVSNEVDFCHQLYFPLPQIEPKQRALSLF